MKISRAPIILSVIAVMLAFARPLGAAENGAFEKLLQNNFDAPENPATLEEMFAALHAARISGKSDVAKKTALKLVPEAAQYPQGVYFLKYLSWADSEKERTESQEVLEKITVDAKTHPLVKAFACEQLANRYEWRLNPEAAKKFSRQTGKLNNCALVVGNFLDPRPASLDRTTSFEQNPASGNYTDETGKEAEVVYDLESDVGGQFHVPARLEPHFSAFGMFHSGPVNSGSPMYAIFIFSSEKEHAALLEIPGRKDMRLWLNTLPVYRPDASREYMPETECLRINLNAGINVLVAKVMNTSIPNLKILGTDFTPDADVKTVSWEEGKEAVKPLAELHGVVASRAIEAPQLDFSAFPAKADSAFAAIIKAGLLFDNGQVGEAKDIFAELAAKYPDSLMLKVFTAELLNRESNLWVDSKDRLQKEAANILRDAVEKNDKLPLLHLMLANYFRQHDDDEQEIEHLKKCLELSPESANAAAALAEAEDKRGRTEIAINIVKDAASKSDRACNVLISLLEKQGQFTEAAKLRSYLSEGDRLLWAIDDMLAHGEYDMALASIEKEIPLYPQQQEVYANALIKCFKAKGDTKSLIKALGEKRLENPRNPAICIDLAEALLSAGEKHEAIKMFEEAQERTVATGGFDFNLLKRLRALNGEKWENEKYDLSLSEIDSDAYTPKKYPQASQASLIDVQVARVFPNNAAEILVHKAIKVLTKDGVAQLGEFRMPNDPNDLLYVRTITPDGKVYEPTNIRELNFAAAASLYHIAPGCIVEFAFKSEMPAGMTQSFHTSFRPQNFNMPVARSRFCLIMPDKKEKNLSVKAWPRDFAPKKVSAAKGTALVWDANDLEVIEFEPSLPPYDEIFVNLDVEIREMQFTPNIFGLPESRHGSTEIKRKAEELTKDLTTIKDKVKALHAFVRGHIKTSSNDPRTARDVMAMESGEIDSATDLFAALLEAAGIEFSKGRVNDEYDNHYGITDDRGTILNPQMFRTEIIMVPDGPDYLWTRFNGNYTFPLRNFRPFDLDRRIAGSPAILKDASGLVTMRRVMDNKLEKKRLFYDTTVNLKDDASARVGGKIFFHGSNAGRLRSVADMPQNGKRYVESYALRVYRGLSLETSEYVKPEASAGDPQSETEPFVYTFAGTVKNFLQKENGKLSFSPFPGNIGGAGSLLADRNRDFDFLVQRDVEDAQDATFVAPDGWAFEHVPQSALWACEFGLFGMSFSVDGNVLRTSRFFLVPSRRIEKKHYAALAEFAGAVSRTDKLSVTLVKLSDVAANAEFTRIRETTPKEDTDLSSFNVRWEPEKK